MFSCTCRSKLVLLLLLFCPVYLACKAKGMDFSKTEFLITSNGDQASSAAADYLYEHISRRIKSARSLRVTRSDYSMKDDTGARIYLEVVPDLKQDYEIKNSEHMLAIFGRDRDVLKWLSYMLIDHISQFHPIEVADLPPGYIDFEDSKGTFAFSYREPHFVPNLNEDHLGIYHTHSIDRDWGIWGHNLYKVLPEDLPADAYALIAGQRDRRQYCLSSDQIYKALESYIGDQYGDRDPKWFMIAPNDNDLACTCATCEKQGNRPGDATAANVYLLNRLAERFPEHHFFTTAYRTTKNAPQQHTKNNVGVFISTIDLPTTVDLNPADQQVLAFLNLVKQWQGKTDQLFLWNYVANFDDYLTPYPALFRTRSQLQFFQSLGVKGIFMNGSGYDYTSFDDVKTYVLSALMINPLLPVDRLVRNYCSRFYPVTGDLLATYYLQMEGKVVKGNMDTGMYTGFREASQRYFDAEKFLTLFKELKKLVARTKGAERSRLDRLITAMSYTDLQISYSRGAAAGGFLHVDGEMFTISSAIKESLQRLENNQGHSGISIYKEDQGQLDRYCGEWRNLMQHPLKKNKIRGLKVQASSSSEPPKDADVLFDNVPGFGSDFHQGWFLSAEDLLIEDIRLQPFRQTQQLSIRFLVQERHRMLPPEAIELFVNDQFADRFTPADLTNDNGVMVLNKDLRITQNEKLHIKIYKNRKIKHAVIACDEIQLF